jgi:N6-adenosine-specific RNA methylase IME4
LGGVYRVSHYRTIVADPPWDMAWRGGAKTRRKGDGTVYFNGNTSIDRLPYAVMTIDGICALPVADLAHDDAHLYLWTTDEHLLDGSAARVASAWGFKPERTIVWRKANYGMGHGWRPAHEILVLARRGSLPFEDVSLATVQDWKQPYVKTGGSVAKLHSAKPDGFLDRVEQVSPGPYVELFARRDRLGWDTWGNESLGTAEMAA